MSYIIHPQKGFIALISIMIMSVVLLATTLSLAQFGLASRFFILDLEHKSASEKLAEACVHTARISVYNDPLYNPTSPVTIPVGDKSCTILSVQPNGNQSLVKVTATSGTATTNMQVLIDNTNGDFVSWNEVPTF
jgi:hypothetical protein